MYTCYKAALIRGNASRANFLKGLARVCYKVDKILTRCQNSKTSLEAHSFGVKVEWMALEFNRIFGARKKIVYTYVPSGRIF